jgi:hypothetical protein
VPASLRWAGKVLALYRAMEDHAGTAVVPDMERVRGLMVEQPPEDCTGRSMGLHISPVGP